MTGSKTETATQSAHSEAVPRAKQLVDEALDRLFEALRQGKSEALLRYLAAMARFHQYSVHNVFLILAQRPDATHVAGFGTWKTLGRYVRKGEKGILILAPILIRRQSDASNDNDEEDSEVIVRFRGVYVFDVSQTEGTPLPEPVHVGGDPRFYLSRLRAHIVACGITIDAEPALGTAEGVSHGGSIGVRAGLSAPREFAVLVHELAHELMHRGAERPQSKTIRELEAEAVAFVVSHAIGLDAGVASSDYIQLYDGKPETLSQSLDRIQRAASQILEGIQSE